MSLAQNWLLTAVSTPPEKIKEEIEMSDDLVIAGDEFHARDLEQAAVIPGCIELQRIFVFNSAHSAATDFDNNRTAPFEAL